MRLPSLAGMIAVLVLAGYPFSASTASRVNAAAREPQGTRGPMTPVSPDNDTQQEQQQLPQAAQPLQVQTTVVNVFATVRDHHNAIVSDLTKDDFKIYEDGVEQKVQYFSREVDMPITLGLLMDTSGSMDRNLSAEQDAASRFVREILRKKDEAMVISFDLDVNLLADFTEDPEVLERAIRRTTINAAGPMVTPGTIPQNGAMGTDLYDAVYLACHDELANEAGRKGVIILTDAEDNGSKVSMEDSIEAAQRADAVIHVLLIRDFMATSGTGPGVARRMTEDTGGRVIDVRNSKSLESAFDEIATELRSQYVLGYSSTNTKRDGTFRKIKVEVDKNDLKILARKGYYAPFQ
jgi:VWFA-related protein